MIFDRKATVHVIISKNFQYNTKGAVVQGTEVPFETAGGDIGSEKDENQTVISYCSIVDTIVSTCEGVGKDQKKFNDFVP